MKTFTFVEGLERVKTHFEDIAKRYEKIIGKPYNYVIGENSRQSRCYPAYSTVPAEMIEDYMFYDRITYQVNYQDEVFSQGYELIGLIDYTEDPVFATSLKDEFTVNDKIEQFRTFKCACCNSTRKRNKAFLVEKDNKVEVVGSKCVKEYVGISPSMFSNFAMFAPKLDDPDYLRGLDFGRDVYPVHVNLIIRAAAFFIKYEGGYVKSCEDFSTVGKVKSIIDAQMSDDPDTREWVEEVFSKNIDVEGVKAYWMAQKATNEFTENIQKLIENEVMSEKWVGIASYMYEGYRRSLEKAIEKPEFIEGHSLDVGRKELTLIKVIFEKWFDSQFGGWGIIKYLTSDNHVVTYKGSSSIDHNFDEPVTVKATVSHDEYASIKFNKISRIKVLQLS